MKNINGWMFLIIALMWLLPLVIQGADWMIWVAILALAYVGYTEVKK